MKINAVYFFKRILTRVYKFRKGLICCFPIFGDSLHRMGFPARRIASQIFYDIYMKPHKMYLE